MESKIMENSISPSQTEMLKTLCKALDDKFGKDIVVLDIRGISIMADFFVIATGNNPNQVKAMSDEAAHKLSDIGVKMRHSEGYQTASWILLDFGSIIVHIFDKESRAFYNLERVWADAPQVRLDGPGPNQ